jgi:hypothetical protein
MLFSIARVLRNPIRVILKSKTYASHAWLEITQYSSIWRGGKEVG